MEKSNDNSGKASKEAVAKAGKKVDKKRKNIVLQDQGSVPIVKKGTKDILDGHQLDRDRFDYSHKKVPPAEKLAAVSSQVTGEPPELTIPVTEKDVAIMEKKAEIQQLWEFDKWVLTKVCQGKLAEDETKRAWLRKIYPDVFERMIHLDNLALELKKELEILKIRNPSNFSELYKQYWYDEQIKELEGTLKKYSDAWGIPRTDFNVEKNTQPAAFQRGIMNLYRRQKELVYLVDNYKRHKGDPNAPPKKPVAIDPSAYTEEFWNWLQPTVPRDQIPPEILQNEYKKWLAQAGI